VLTIAVPNMTVIRSKHLELHAAALAYARTRLGEGPPTIDPRGLPVDQGYWPRTAFRQGSASATATVEPVEFET